MQHFSHSLSDKFHVSERNYRILSWGTSSRVTWFQLSDACPMIHKVSCNSECNTAGSLPQPLWTSCHIYANTVAMRREWRWDPLNLVWVAKALARVDFQQLPLTSIPHTVSWGGKLYNALHMKTYIYTPLLGQGLIRKLATHTEYP
jgi:hypothetical protein